MVAAWNGLAISALAECGLLLGRPGFIDAARAAATVLAEVHYRERPAGPHLTPRFGRGHRGRAGGLRLRRRGPPHPVRGDREARWPTLAGQLLDTALTAFGDGQGGFYDTAADGEALIFRPADAADNATPSGTFAMSGALLSYAALTGSARHREAAVAALGVLPAIAGRYPRARGRRPGGGRGRPGRAGRDRDRRSRR